ncbi:Serine-type endopeptidase inhibitor [Rhynchospora pubera]|uniref:Serine-type endopeptidase inhibitor n=1 Tax=Rhynchospora pubera TaxID=906938 RepID=A0AAV8DGR1_9POAL|nr:Serine-type endopeptidase inhibitor [Rhynchospora pubera]
MPSFPSCLLFLSLLLSFSFSQTFTLASSVEELSLKTDPCPALSDGFGSSCPVSCFRPDPVCGINGVTYWCGCPEAACAGVVVAKKGYCEVTDGGPGPVSGQALLLVHIVWLFVLGFAVLFGFL